MLFSLSASGCTSALKVNKRAFFMYNCTLCNKIRIKLIHIYLEFLRMVAVPVDITDFIKCESLSHTSRLYMAGKLI